MGSRTRLCGIDVFHEFRWRDEFRDERTQFRNGQCLARFVREKASPGKTPALLLTLRDGLRQGFRHTRNFSVFVVNLPEYTAAAGDTALSYLAGHLGVDITDVEQLHQFAAGADPEAVRAFVEAHLDLEAVANWMAQAEGRRDELLRVVGSDGPPTTLGGTLAASEALESLSSDDVQFLAEFFGSASTRQQRLDLLRAVTTDPDGRTATGEILVERIPERIQDAREALSDYEQLLSEPTTSETAMQQFIEAHMWLLGLDYAVMRPRKTGPSGASDFLLQRYDGFHDLLELKSPQDDIIRAPSVRELEPVPSPHEYALSPALAQALAQAIVYRDRLTRHAAAADELHGLPYARDPRLIIVVGRASSLPEHRRRVLFELNKSLHRMEVVPYDVLALRAKAMLDNVEEHLLTAEAVTADEESEPAYPDATPSRR